MVTDDVAEEVKAEPESSQPWPPSGLSTGIYSREQIYVHGPHIFVMKKLEKEVFRFANAGFEVDQPSMLRFCRDFFEAELRERAKRAAREEAWRREWSGKKGQVKNLFDQIDTDGSGFIDFTELETALRVIPDFFGYSEAPTGSIEDGTSDAAGSGKASSAAPEGIREWLQDEVDKGSSGSGATALFTRLDADGDGQISWEEFWNTIGLWMDTGFNVLEELRQKELERQRELERLRLEEEMRRRAAEEEAARRAAEEQARLDEEERYRLAMEADRLRKLQMEEEERLRREEHARREAMMAAKAEEERLKREAEQAAAALEAEARRRAKAERDALEAAEREAAEAARLAAEEEARRRAAEAEAERLRREEELRRWNEAVAAAVAVAMDVIARNDPDGLQHICKEALFQLSQGEPGSGDAGAALLLSTEAASSGQLFVCAVAQGRSTPGNVAPGMLEPSFPPEAHSLVAQCHAQLSGGAQAGDTSEEMGAADDVENSGGDNDVEDSGAGDDGESSHKNTSMGGRPVFNAEGVGLGALCEPLKGRAFGSLCSGGVEGRGRVPDEFLGMMTAAMGELLDAAWRNARLLELVDVAQSFFDTLFDGDDRLDGEPEWRSGEGPSAKGGGHGGKTKDGNAYEISLKNLKGGSAYNMFGPTAGTIRINIKDGAALNESLEDALMVTAQMLSEVKRDLDQLGPGDPLPDWVPKGLLDSTSSLDRAKLLKLALPQRMLQYAKDKLAAIPIKDLVGELKSYKTPPEAVTRVMQGVILLIGRAETHKDIPEWMKGVQQQMNAPMVKDCLSFDASIEGRQKAWNESNKATKGLSVEEVLKRGSAAVQIFQKWVESCRLVRLVCEDLRAEERGEPTRSQLRKAKASGSVLEKAAAR